MPILLSQYDTMYCLRFSGRTENISYIQSVSKKEIENYLANYIIINIKQSIRNRILKVDILKS